MYQLINPVYSQLITNFGILLSLLSNPVALVFFTSGGQWELETALVEDDGIKGFVTSQKQHISARFVAIATGHHAKPSIPKFPGQETFKGISI